MRFGDVEWRLSVDSTNTLLLTDPRPGRVLVAEHQRAGLGRRGRSWTAPPGAALAISAVVASPGPELVGWVPLVAGLAVAQALGASRYGVSARLKWPNDVLVAEGGRWLKVCGVLAQATRHQAHGAVVVVGAGVNVDQLRADLPVESATSWRLARGGAVLPEGARETLVRDYLDHLGEALSDLPAARAPYLALCSTVGSAVAVHLPDGSERTGVAVGVDGSGALVVADAHGHRAVHHAGDVVHLRPAGYPRRHER